MKKNKISKEWITRQHRDVYVKKSKQEGFRSRAVYKLEEINNKYKILKNGLLVIDLGAAPGGWSQFVIKKYKNCKLNLNSFLQTTFKKYCFIDTLQKKHEERKIEIHRKTHQTLRFLQPKAFFDLSLERILFIFDEIPDLTIVFPSWKIDPFKFNKLRFVFPSGKSSWHP